MSGDPEPPRGALRSLPAADTSSATLSELSLRELAEELLRRLRDGADPDDERHDLHLFSALSMLLEASVDRQHNRMSRAYLEDRLRYVVGAPHGLDRAALEGATVVELGCGGVNPLSVATVLALAGAAKVVAIDLDRVHDPADAARAVLRAIFYLTAYPHSILPGLELDASAIAARLRHFDLVKLWGGDLTGLDAERVRLERRSVHESGLSDGEADVVFSTSFLEHVTDVDEVLAELARVTRPGGLGSHGIDAQDHKSFHGGCHPMAFLTSHELASDSGCNLLRPQQFVERFEAHGFEVLQFEPHKRIHVDEALRATFIEPYCSMDLEDLSVLQAGLRVRRL